MGWSPGWRAERRALGIDRTCPSTCPEEHVMPSTPPPWAAKAAGARRMDPEECGCTDCLTGYSVPLDQANADQLWAVLAGEMEDATGLAPESWQGARDVMRDALVAWARN